MPATPSATPQERRVHNPKPRPRVVFLGGDQDASVSIEIWCGTLRRFADVAGWTSELSIQETDLVITAVSGWLPQGPHALWWGCGPIGERGIGPARQFARELNIQDQNPPEFATAVDQLVRALDKSQHPPQGLDLGDSGFTPLLATTDRPVAAVYERRSDNPRAFVDAPGTQYGLVVPQQADLSLWLQAFLQFLHGRDKEAVPRPPPIMSAPEKWYTPEEAIIVDRIAELDNQVVALAMDRAAAEDELRDLGKVTDQDERAVLWADGDDLVVAVTKLLTTGLDFHVIDADQPLQEEPLHEDLRVSPPDDLDRVALVEVKGYLKGARTNDLQQINKHVINYAANHGARPYAIWWIINDHRSSDPSSRPPPLQGAERQPSLFGVVAIPTRALYRLWQDVVFGIRTQLEARAALLAAEPGVWGAGMEGQAGASAADTSTTGA